MLKSLFLSLILFCSIVSAETYTFSAAEWPPYMCKKCPDQGLGVSLTKKMFKAAGHVAKFKFFPTWEKSMAAAVTPDFMGQYAVWEADLTGTNMVISAKMFESPVGVAELSSKPLKVKSVNDLIGKKIGIVTLYGYFEEFNNLVKQKKINVIRSNSDQENMEKLAKGEIDGTIIDFVNFKYVLATDLRKYRGQIRMNSTVLANLPLYIGVRYKDLAKINEILEVGHKAYPNSQEELTQAIDKYFSVYGVNENPSK